MRDISEASAWEIVWHENLSVGIDEIDEDHRRFIGLVNDLNQAINEPQKNGQINHCLQLIVLDAKRHFEHEQRLFSLHGYPDAAHHAALHTKLLGEIVTAMDCFREAAQGKHWIEKGLQIKTLLVEHLLNEDMQYRDFLVSRMMNRNSDTAGTRS